MTEQDKNTVYILDSYGLIFRCYFAFISRPLTNPKGENVSALFGFFRNLHWILQHYQPGYIFAAMDSKTKTFRHEKYDLYKANRNKTPDDLHAQIPWIEDVLKELGIPVLQCDGYEADDIIATVAKKCEESGRQCRILSGDKDLMQLVTQTTQILKPESGASTWKITGIDGVEAEWGVKPAQLLDLLSLYGDSADNIPGVAGVGVKTASKLLNDYGDLDGIYNHINEIKGAMQKKLIDGKKDAYFSQELVRLCADVPCNEIDDALNQNPLQLNFSQAAQKLFDYGVPNVAKSYAELGGYTLKAKSSEEETPVDNNSKKQTSSLQKPINFEDEPVINLIQNDTKGYKALTKLNELENFINEYLNQDTKTNPIAYDSETTSLDTLSCDIVGFSLAWQEGKAVYVPLQQPSQDLFSQTDYIDVKDALNQLLRLFTNPCVSVIMHNAKFDLKVLASNINRHIAVKQNQLEQIKCQIFDTMILAWLINPERTGRNGYSLEYLCETLLGLKGIEFNDIVAKGQSFSDVPLEKALPYAAEDADFTLKLFKKLVVQDKNHYNSISDDYSLNSESLYAMEMKVLPVLAQMELTGIHLDSAALHAYNKELSEGLIETEKEIYKTVGHEFNIASPKQLQTVLFEELNLPKGKKTKTGYSTDTSVLEELAAINPVPKMILEYRELAKLQSTYVETLPQMTDSANRIHTDFVQTGTATGRLSCREPNLQNIPVRNEAGRRIRQAFTAPQGKVLISADYAQIELVVLAHLSKDEKMCESFNTGTDVHKATAAMIYGVKPEDVTPQMRRTAKTINFGVIYGMSAFRLAQDLDISRTQASMFIDNYFSMYSKINGFIHQTVIDAESCGYVTTIFGRHRPIININSRNKIEKSAAERIAVNSPVQGSAADIVKKAMLDVSQALKDSGLDARLLLQVHDELIFECKDDESEINKTIALIKEKMENAVKLAVPLKVSIEYGKNWGEFH